MSSDDTRNALALARRLDDRLLPALSPDWWRLRKLLRASYRFSEHAIQPSWTEILEKLDAEHEQRAEHYNALRAIGDEFHVHRDVAGFVRQLTAFRNSQADNSVAGRALFRFVLSHNEGDRTIRDLAGMASLLHDFRRLANQFLQDWDNCSLIEIQGVLQYLMTSVEDLPEYLHCLEALVSIDERVGRSLRILKLSIQQLRAASADRSVRLGLRENPDIRRFDATLRKQTLKQLSELIERIYSQNADAIREFVRQRFCDNFRLADAPASQLTEEELKHREDFNRGSRQLQHEFGKTMRFKSIRELAEGESGTVIRDLKPVWLMSPLSVSDTLPLSAQNFDAVIFDEASQITLEDAVPALFRASQTIVVGDDMQLPPTSFFGGRRTVEDEIEFEQDGETVCYDLNSSSLLNHASRSLGTGMLGWHYRSRSESLISFSNHAFYGGQLLTVPEERLFRGELAELVVSDPDDAVQNSDGLLQRPVSFHFVEDGIYTRRRNTLEADYIARLVRELLTRNCGYSIGVVAFSEAQQSEIESALRRLASTDADFAELLDAELERENNGQFEGLLVRNLENIQGDERDIIMMSVCYGPDEDGRIRMNFGPINMAGGEKRLNVAFSRARQFMALVSSMRSEAITNDYNDGARCLKRYLKYAEACSAGRMESVRDVLTSLGNRSQATDRVDSSGNRLVQELAEVIRGLGYETDLDVGHSQFRVDVAVRSDNDTEYRLGILTDGTRWYGQKDLLERELLKPLLLQAFGWQVIVITARDWYFERDSCLTELRKFLDGQEA